MSDIAIRVQVENGDGQRVTVPSDMNTSEFLTELLEGLKLPTTNGDGYRLKWQLTDKSTGRALSPERTLEGNDVQAHQELQLQIIKEEAPSSKESKTEESQPDAVACRHCGFKNEAGNKFCRKCGKAIAVAKPSGDIRLRVHTGGDDSAAEEVEVPADFNSRNLIAELLGSAAQEAEWKLYDKDTGNDLDPSKSLAENGVRSGHELYLRSIPKHVEISKKEKGKEKEQHPPRPFPWMIVGIVTTLVVVATAGALIYHSIANRVVITPARIELKPSEHQQFTATIGGRAQQIQWSISPQLGSINSEGMYAAPPSVSAPVTVTVTAVSANNPEKLATSQITLQPSSTRGVLQVRPETATLTGNESVKLAVIGSGVMRWSIEPNVGTISSDGLYTAPAPIPTETAIKVTATEEEDPSSSVTAIITLKPVTLNLSPESTTLQASTSLAFKAVLTGTTNRGLRWSVSGPGYMSKNGVYFAPPVVEEGQVARITATSSADPTKSATALVRLRSVVAISVSPANVSLVASQRVRFSASLSGTTNTAVRWTLSGPGAVSADGEYQAPSLINSEETARITATSNADPSKVAVANVTLQPLMLTITPGSAKLYASQAQRFSVLVVGNNNHQVRWAVAGRGSISQEGVYAAPPLITEDQLVRITATSIVDPSRSASVSVTLKRYDGPMMGTLIWSGTLEKNGTVTIDDAGASRGAIQGEMLPGLPVQIALDDNKNFGVAQAPGPSNGWRRITLNSKKGKGSAVRIKWTVVEGGKP